MREPVLANGTSRGKQDLHPEPTGRLPLSAKIGVLEFERDPRWRRLAPIDPDFAEILVSTLPEIEAHKRVLGLAFIGLPLSGLPIEGGESGKAGLSRTRD